METPADIFREMRGDYAFALRGCGEKVGQYITRLEAAVARLEAERDQWRKMALCEDARANRAEAVR